MYELLRAEVGDRHVRVVATERGDGDMHPGRVPPDVLAERQRGITGSVWPMLDQVHGTHLVLLPSRDAAPVGDIALSRVGGPPVAVWAADCAPVALIGTGGTIAMVHAGWRGLATGVLDVAVPAVTDADGGIVAAVLGPTIGPCCYEFSSGHLGAVAEGVGCATGAVAGRTSWGTTALDVPAAVRAGLGRYGVDVTVTGPCTGCDERCFSHRCRGDAERHALVAWTEAA